MIIEKLISSFLNYETSNFIIAQIETTINENGSSDSIISRFIVLTTISIGFLLSLFLVYLSRFKKCPSDRIMVIYGRTGQGAARCIHGGATFVWPFLQDYGFLSLRPMQIEVNLHNALCQQNIRINVPSVFTVGITTDPHIMNNAAERLFGQHSEAIAGLAKDIIFGQLRLVIASLTIEEINRNRENFLREIEKNVASELNKIGLQLLNVNITDITDESGYIDAIGKRAAAEAIQKAKIDVAVEERKGGIGQAEAQKEQRIRVSELETEAQMGEAEAQKNRRIALKQAEAEAQTGEAQARKTQIIEVAKAEAEAQAGEAEAHRQQRIAVSQAEAGAQAGEADADRTRRIAIKQADALAIDGENKAKIEIARSNASRIEEEALAYQKAEAAKRVADAMIQKTQYQAEEEAQAARVKMEMEKQRAEIIVSAEIAKEQVQIAAEAEAEKRRREAKGEADAIFAKLDAEARGNFEILKAKGTGFQSIISACDNNADAASKMLLIEKLEELVKQQAEAIKNIKIDKITVWDNGNNSANGGKNATANFVSGMFQSLPALHDVANMAGLDLPKYLGTVKENTLNEVTTPEDSEVSKESKKTEK